MLTQRLNNITRQLICYGLDKLVMGPYTVIV